MSRKKTLHIVVKFGRLHFPPGVNHSFGGFMALETGRSGGPLKYFSLPFVMKGEFGKADFIELNAFSDCELDTSTFLSALGL